MISLPIFVSLCDFQRIAELSMQSESVSSPTAPPTGPWHDAPEGLSIQLADSKAKLRRLKQEL